MYLKKPAHVPKILNSMEEIKRDFYLNQLIAGKQNGLIKIVTGIRRCGKSYILFKMFRKHLIDKGVNSDHILSIAFDDVLNEEYCNPKTLLLYIKSQIKDASIYYVLLDEVQMVENFEGALNSLLHIENVDVYVTGSNSKFLSSDIATEFRGRGDEIRIYPLSFSEYLSAYNGDKYDAWRDYVTYGGLPLILSLETNQQKINYLKNLYSTLYLKDLIDRNGIKKPTEFDTLVKVMASSIGSPCNPNKLSNTFKSEEKTVLSSFTIDSYLRMMQDAFLLEKACRYDIKGKKYIGTLSKYYFVDMGLRNSLLDFRQIEETHLMENVIYNELRSRGYLVDVGLVDIRTRTEAHGMIRKQFEVDFVVNSGSKRYYIQSALALPSEEKLNQESASLKLISDNFQKIIIVKDNIISHHNDDGILFVNLFDFLLNKFQL